MHIEGRPARREDLAVMLSLSVPPEAKNDAAKIHAATEVWHGLWDSFSPDGIVLEDLSNGEPETVGFMLGVYVTDEAYRKHIINADSPGLLERIVQAEQRTHTIALPPERVGVANFKDGLNLMVCYIGWAGDDYQTESTTKIRGAVANAYIEHTGGNRVKRMFGELGGEKLLSLMLRLGCKVLNDYKQWASTNGCLEAPKRPYLVGISKEDALQSENYWLSRVFSYFPPVFRFTESQRDILLLARDGLTDVEIAQVLDTTPDAVKKRWTSIYSRVNRLNPKLLPEQRVVGRGQEKRRALLAHLRHRLEELRPYTPSKR